MVYIELGPLMIFWEDIMDRSTDNTEYITYIYIY